MKSNLIKMDFFETYYYASVIHNVLRDASGFMRGLHEWHEDQAIELLLPPFQKWSVLHSFSFFIIDSLIDEKIEDENPKSKLWIEHAFSYHGIAVESFSEWLKNSNIDIDDINAVYEYHNELRVSGQLEELILHLTNEVFLLLFSNRQLLTNLNAYVAGIVSSIELDDLSEGQIRYLSANGVPARATVPEWAKRAVFFRDRGRCVSCNSDISNLVSLQSSRHFDHIVPLARGGINDVTNIQLLCEMCNLTKGAKNIGTTSMYEPWYI